MFTYCYILIIKRFNCHDEEILTFYRDFQLKNKYLDINIINVFNVMCSYVLCNTLYDVMCLFCT